MSKLDKKMKIAYFINTFPSTNWGGQATSNGIKYLLSKEYPNATFVPLNLSYFTFRKIKLLRLFHDISLLNALLDNDEQRVIRILKKINIPENYFEGYTHICFNGEGAIHYKSGHLIRFMGLLYLAKLKNIYVASINQTIDLNKNRKLESLISKIYNMCDFVSTREPISFELAKKIGIKNCKLIPDAVYGLPIMKNDDIVTIVNKYKLPKTYITMTGSSALKRNRNSVKQMDKILKYTKDIFKETPVIFMVNAKTDLYIAEKLKNKYNLEILNSTNINYQEAIAVISQSLLLIGGRQHPNIFAYIYKVPYISFDGNTFKNEGVAKLQGYPIKPLHWNTNFEKFSDAVEKVFNNKIKYKNIKIDNFKIFGR